MAVNQPLSKLLDDLLTPMELAWHAIDANTIEITTPQALAAKMDVEFYPIGNMAHNAAEGRALAAKITSEIEPQLWGEDLSKPCIYFDSVGNTLIIRAPQPLQAKAHAFLATQPTGAS